uniref:RNA binding motif protein 27 n=1 Tax=Latimeria chalumnae TaxID=7897 RepID=M3XH62_LATCH|nr:PREDICTED: RNA-binding protein 27 isoform X1 [Latimeria chalumnae]XP_014343927.1 PREDICTED: RNA-binding protein 27 isoform X1 [Latimeria chalumnae]|eukprot:XP_014343926.1 PREDICTED: RNA-binding protein 27 isoform X1 [Latimeria chalumnae]
MSMENIQSYRLRTVKELKHFIEPDCEADPSALANYVVALVKKDKPEKELKAFCADQLDVFLQKETSGFVDKLFECLNTKNYLCQETRKQETKPEDGEKEEIKPFQDVQEEEQDGKKTVSPLRTRSDSAERRNRDKKRDDSKRKEYDRYTRTDLYKDRYDWRRGRSRSRERSYSPNKSRGSSQSRSCSRGRSRDLDSGRGREHRERAKFDPERIDLEGSHVVAPVPSTTSSQQYSSGGQVNHSSVTVVAPAHHPDNTTESWSSYYSNQNATNSFNRNSAPKRRCRDYDEKGFCVRGDLCLFDHGNDPLVVDDVALPSMIPFPPPPRLPPPGLLMPPMPGPPPLNMRLPIPAMHGHPPSIGVIPHPGPPLIPTSTVDNHEHSGTSTVPSLAPPGIRPSPPLPQHLLYTVSEHTYEPDGYNPEAPSITGTGRPQYRQFYPRAQTQRPNLIGLTSSDMDTPSRAANIVIQTEPSAPVRANNNANRVFIEPDNRKRSMSNMDGPFAKKPWIERQGINQNKPGFPKKNQYTNTKLEVRKIPQELNTITKLNEHFSKFGTIVNIQVAFGGDPEGALIQYTANEEARRAISSAEAVLNNRFIRVLWHRENNEPHHHPQLQQQQTQIQTQPPPAVPMQQPNIHKVLNKPPTAGSYVLNKTPLKQRLGGSQPNTVHSILNQSNSPGDVSQSFPISTSLTKTVYSSTALKTTPKLSATVTKSLETQEALKKKQEALKLQQDMRKKRQEMLHKQIECQKMLIAKLEKNKTMKPEERTEIMKTLKELTEKISQLKDELKPMSTTVVASASSQQKSKTDAQKELLDAELDLHKRLTSGEDTTELRKKLSQLQVEAARLGILPGGRGKVVHQRGRGRGRGRNLRGRGALTNMVVDHRPKALTVFGFSEEEKDELLPHFSKFGEVENLKEEDSPLSVMITFKTRLEAENAANQGARFKGRTLQISWYRPKAPSVSTEPEEEETKEEETETADLFLHEDDDEEEDENESRSWRR